VYVGSGGSSGTVALETSATYTFSGNLGLNQVGIGDADRRRNRRPRDRWAAALVYLLEGRYTRGHLRRRLRCVGVLTGAGWSGDRQRDYDGDGALDLITGNPKRRQRGPV
jgi:hypothetical protein